MGYFKTIVNHTGLNIFIFYARTDALSAYIVILYTDLLKKFTRLLVQWNITQILMFIKLLRKQITEDKNIFLYFHKLLVLNIS